jgi:hypothetical protein
MRPWRVTARRKGVIAAATISEDRADVTGGKESVTRAVR